MEVAKITVTDIGGTYRDAVAFIILILVTKEKTDDNMINPPDSGEGFP